MDELLMDVPPAATAQKDDPELAWANDERDEVISTLMYVFAVEKFYPTSEPGLWQAEAHGTAAALRKALEGAGFIVESTTSDTLDDQPYALARFSRAKTVIGAIPVTEPVEVVNVDELVDAATAAEYPFVSLFVAGADAVAMLWEHYRATLLVHTTDAEMNSAQRAGKRAAAIILYAYREDSDRLEGSVGAFSSPSNNALFLLHAKVATPSLETILSQLAETDEAHLRQLSLNGDADQYIVDPVRERVTAQEYHTLYYGRLQRDKRCKVYYMIGNQKHLVQHVTRDAGTRQWFVHLAEMAMPVKVDIDELFLVEEIRSTPSGDKRSTDELPVVKTQGYAHRVDIHKYGVPHVTTRLRNHVREQVPVPIKSAYHLHSNHFHLSFQEAVHPNQLAAIDLDNVRVIAIELDVPPAWMGMPEQDPIPAKLESQELESLAQPDQQSVIVRVSAALTGQLVLSADERHILVDQLLKLHLQG